MVTDQLKEIRKQMFDQMERKLTEGQTPEGSLFYHHPSEDRIVLSHALFWIMTKHHKGKMAKEKYFLLLRQYQEEMLDAYLTESDYFRSCCDTVISFMRLYPKYCAACTIRVMTRTPEN